MFSGQKTWFSFTNGAAHCVCPAPINYNKVKTANNNPKISQKMRYSQYVRQPGVNCSKALTPAGQIVESAR